jgi:CubicO group peptidase (beta-lactamase class C family)
MKLATYFLVPFLSIFISAQAIADKSTDLQNALEVVMKKYKISDLSVSVMRSGKTFYMSDLHLQSDGELLISGGSTQFRIASISKLFTAQAVMQLQEKGKLSLDDKVSVYIPSLSDSKITIKDLLTHYGGLKDRVWPEKFSKESSFDAYLLKVLAANQKIQAGISYQYSDTGFNILGEIISHVSGLNYQTYIERNILKPASMKKSGYYSGLVGIHPTVEPFKNGLPIPLDLHWPYDPQFFPSEGLISNVHDLTRWVKLVLTMDSKLLTKTSYEQMLSPRLDTTLERTRIGWCWFVTQRNNIDYAYHMGGIRGYESILAIQADAGNAIIILTNSSDVPRWEIIDLIERTIKSRP